MTTKWIYWFDELTKDSYELVGKKCANLGEMTRSGLPVPPGFALSIDAYNLFMRETGAAEKVREYLATDPGDLVRDEAISRHIREIVESHDLPERMKIDVSREYQKLCNMVGIPDLPVAVRSSGAVSMPGQMESFLNVRGDENVFRKIIEVWGSSFTHQAVAYRFNKNLPVESFPIGVAVMKVVNAKCSGVAFSIHPNTGDRTRMLIEGNWGLGEGVVGGEVTPDRWVIDRGTGESSSLPSTTSSAASWPRAAAPSGKRFPPNCRTCRAPPTKRCENWSSWPNGSRKPTESPRTSNGCSTATSRCRRVCGWCRPGRPRSPKAPIPNRRTRTSSTSC